MTTVQMNVVHDSQEDYTTLLARQCSLAEKAELAQQKYVNGQKQEELIWQEYRMVRHARLAQQDILDQQKNKMVQLEASIAQNNDTIVHLRLVAARLDQTLLSLNKTNIV